MKGEKYHIYLSTKERNEIVAFLINLKNKLIEQGRYTDAVDDVLCKVLSAKKRKLKITGIASQSVSILKSTCHALSADKTHMFGSITV